MKKYLFILCVFFGLVGCVAPVDETADEVSEYASGTAESSQSTQACLFETVAGATKTTSIPLVPGAMSVTTKIKNYGTQTCQYRLSIDIYDEPYVSPGTIIYATPIASGTLGSSLTRTHNFVAPDVRPCKFRVWVKYSPTNNSTLTWHNVGLFDCHT